jgi:ankyrin repeat protein/rubrerythrin
MSISPELLLLVKSQDEDGLGKKISEKGADLEAKDSDGFTLLHIAAIDGEPKIISLLIDRGANVNAVTTSTNDTALTILSHRGSSKNALISVQELIKHGAAVNHQEKNGWSALMLASRSGKVEIAQEILRHGPFLDLQNVDGSTALMFAAENGHVEVVNMLIQSGANLNIQNTWSEGGATALTIAADLNHEKMVELLLTAGADVNLQTKRKMSALITACALGHKRIVQMFLEHKADVTLKNIDGHDAMQFAIANGHKEIEDMLREHGVKTTGVANFIPTYKDENMVSGMMLFGTEGMSNSEMAEVRELVQTAAQDVERESLQNEMHIDQSIEGMRALELFNLGVQFADKKLWVNAIDAFDEAVKLQPRFGEAWYAKGVAFLNMYCFSEGLLYLSEAISIDPSHAKPWYTMGLAYTHLRSGQDAIDYYKKSTELEPEMEQAWHNMAEELRLLGRKNEAISCYNHALSLNPNDSLAWHGLGKLKTDIKKINSAEEFEEGLENLEKAHSMGHKKASVVIEDAKKEWAMYQKLKKGDNSIYVCKRCKAFVEGFECPHCGRIRWGIMLVVVIMSLGCVGTAFLSLPGIGFLKYVGGFLLFMVLTTIISSHYKNLDYERMSRSAYMYPFVNIKLKGASTNNFTVIMSLLVGIALGYGFSLLTSKLININIFITLILMAVWGAYSFYVWAGICLGLEDRKKAFAFIAKADGIEFNLDNPNPKCMKISEFKPTQLGSLIGYKIATRKGLFFTIPFGLVWGHLAINYDVIKPLAGLKYIGSFITPANNPSFIVGIAISVIVGIITARSLGWMIGKVYEMFCYRKFK